jgi:hypothetical protein
MKFGTNIAAVAMEIKKEGLNFMKHRRNEQKLMKLDRNNIHI